jgi:Zn-dependent protease
MNFFEQGIPLGRWFGISVVIHWTFLLYALNEFLGSGQQDLAFTALWMFLLFTTVLVHEFGHALSCQAVGGEAYHIVLWPLGGIAFVKPPMKPWAALVTTVCGPLVNAILWPVSWYLLSFMLSHRPAEQNAAFEMGVAVCRVMYRINQGLLLFNLIPAYPMDGGRILQEILWMIVGYRLSLKIAGMVGTVAGVGFVALGLGLYQIKIPVADILLGNGTSWTLVIIGILGAIQSFEIYRQSETIKGWRKR